MKRSPKTVQEESFEVQYTQEGERLDKVLSEIYPDFSRSFFQKLIKDKQIQVNGAVQKASYPVHTECPAECFPVQWSFRQHPEW